MSNSAAGGYVDNLSIVDFNASLFCWAILC